MAAGVIEAAIPGLQLASLSTPLGLLTVACSPEGVVTTFFDDEPGPEDLDLTMRAEGGARRDDIVARGVARAARRQAAEYFAGTRRTISVPPDLALVNGTFARRVLEVVVTIPYGEMWTYGDVAGMAGGPRAARAAGSALAGCPIEVFVPCHRVVHAGGSIGGYGRHEERKRWLLRLEAALDP